MSNYLRHFPSVFKPAMVTFSSIYGCKASLFVLLKLVISIFVLSQHRCCIARRVVDKLFYGERGACLYWLFVHNKKFWNVNLYSKIINRYTSTPREFLVSYWHFHSRRRNMRNPYFIYNVPLLLYVMLMNDNLYCLTLLIFLR